MRKKNHPLNKLLKQIKNNGIKCLLPQNLTDELLDQLLLEADALYNDETEKLPPSTLFLAILHLTSKTSPTKKIVKIEIATETLMDYFAFYATSLKLEELRRKEAIVIAEDSLPTLDNIFDKNRMIGIKQDFL